MRMFLYTGRRFAGIGLGLSFNLTRPWRSQARSGAVGTGFVYVLRRSDHEVKIGSTRNPPQRIKGLQTGSSLPLSFVYVAAASNPRQIESDAVRLLGRFRMQGEWFETSAEAATAALNTAAARLRTSLNAVDPIDAAKHLPPLSTTLTTAERRRGTINFLIVIAAIIAGAMAALEAGSFITKVNHQAAQSSAAQGER